MSDERGAAQPDVAAITLMIILLPVFMAMDVWDGVKRAWGTAIYTYKEIKSMEKL